MLPGGGNRVVLALGCRTIARRCLRDLGILRERAELYLGFGWLLEAVRAMPAAGLAAVASAQVVGLGEDKEWAVVVVLTGLGDGSFTILRFGGVGGHASIFAEREADASTRRRVGLTGR